MNKIHEAINLALSEEKDSLELISKGVNKLSAIYRGKFYEDYFDLPVSGRRAVASALIPYAKVYSALAMEFGYREAEVRLAWCLFGSVDSSADIVAGKANYELSSHCTKCQYGRPFCTRLLPYLTRREQQCFLLMRQGLTDKEIAARMQLAPTTVTKHFSNAIAKLRDMTGKQVTRQYVINQMFLAGV